MSERVQAPELPTGWTQAPPDAVGKYVMENNARRNLPEEDRLFRAVKEAYAACQPVIDAHDAAAGPDGCGCHFCEDVLGMLWMLGVTEGCLNGWLWLMPEEQEPEEDPAPEAPADAPLYR